MENKEFKIKQASDNLSKILNPKESDYERAMRIKKEILNYIGELK